MVHKKSLDNVILFPGMIQKRLEQAVRARENGNYDEAVRLFLEVLEFEPENASARYGLGLSYYDSGDFQKSRELAESMMYSEVGNDPQVLRLYIVSLIQIEDYEAAYNVLQSVLEAHQLPPHLYQEFEELKKTCASLFEMETEQEWEGGWTEASVLKKLEENPRFVEELYEQLTNGDFEQQLAAIERMKFVNEPEVIEMLKEYLVLPGPHPMLKTFALKALKEMGVTGKVSVFKFKQLVETELSDIPIDDDEIPDPQKSVIDLVSTKTQDHDPTVSSFAYQLWMEYLLTVYPFHPDIGQVETWAAALHFATYRTMQRDISREQVADMYRVSVSEITHRFNELNQVLQIPAET
ncbi:MAG: DUF3196 family protein [Bacillaceae bacterium]|nr:DUF3196 family protein [Bacillaceae bacterium]